MLLFIIILVIMQVKDQDQSCLGSQLLYYVPPRLRQGTRKHFHERLYVHVSNILIHLAVFLYRIRNHRSDGAHCSRNFAQVLFS